MIANSRSFSTTSQVKSRKSLYTCKIRKNHCMTSSAIFVPFSLNNCLGALPFNACLTWPPSTSTNSYMHLPALFSPRALSSFWLIFGILFFQRSAVMNFTTDTLRSNTLVKALRKGSIYNPKDKVQSDTGNHPSLFFHFINHEYLQRP